VLKGSSEVLCICIDLQTHHSTHELIHKVYVVCVCV